MSGQEADLHICFASVNAGRILLGHSSGFGGAEVELINLAGHLAQEGGVRVSLVTVTDEIPGETVLRGIRVLPVTPPDPHVASYGFIRRKLTALNYYLRFARALWDAAPDAYFSKLASLESIVTFLVARLRGRIFCFRVEHDWETDPALIREHILRGRRLLTRVFAACLRRADLVICQTVHQQEALARNYGLQAVLINNAHVIPVASESGAGERSQILWIGRAHSMKRPMDFLELARRLPDLRFTMVMWRDPVFAGLYDEVKARGAELPNLTFSPGVPQSEVGELYRSARLYVLTSDAEGFSNTLIEAMKAGTPVLSWLLNFDGLLQPLKSRSGETPGEPGQAGAVGFWAESDFELLVRQTRKLCDDEAFWSACSKRAREYAAKHFDVRTIAPIYVQKIRELVSHP